MRKVIVAGNFKYILNVNDESLKYLIDSVNIADDLLELYENAILTGRYEVDTDFEIIGGFINFTLNIKRVRLN